jgi:hypothetical protein
LGVHAILRIHLIEGKVARPGCKAFVQVYVVPP